MGNRILTPTVAGIPSNRTKDQLMTLDNLDMKIMEEVEDDARQSIRALAKKLGLNSATLHYRLNRLIEERILTIACIANPELLGYQFQLMIGINVSPGKVDAVASRLEALHDVRTISLAVGRYSILAWVTLRDRLALERFISEELTNISDITEIEIMHSYKWLKEAWRYLKPQRKTIRRFPRENPGDLDLSIVRAMQQYPRQTITKLAETVGCSKPVAKARLEKLLGDEVIKVVSIIDASVLGYHTEIGILIKSRLEKINSLVDALAAEDVVRHISLVTGQWQIFAWAQFRDNSHMYGFLSETLTSIPGIIKFEMFHLGKRLKYSTIFV